MRVSALTPEKKSARSREMPHMPHGDVEEGIYFHDVDNERFGQRRDDGPAMERNPRWKEGAPFQGKGRNRPYDRMKRLKRLHDLHLLRVWFSGGHCRYRGLAHPVDLERDI
jgi:hypothetical protein